METTFTSMEPEEEVRGPHWVSRAAFPVVAVIFFLSQVFIEVALYNRWYWLVPVFILITSHLMHGLLIAFHESSHGLLRRSRRINDIDGVLIGIFSLMSFSLYQAAHQSHHAHLSTERDEELWPFVVPTMPRWKRILAAIIELNFGFFFTPFLFFRTFFRSGSPIRNKKVRRRIWREIILMISVWLLLLSAMQWFHLWTYFLCVYFIPAFIAGNLQSWRKYIEHVGMTGDTINSCTRSIVADNWFGRFLSFTLLHEPFHGVHHRYSGLPHAELPARAAALEPATPEELAPFPSYMHALGDLLRKLPDPRVGAQWREASLS